MEVLPKGLCSLEFRAEAVKLVEQTGVSIDRAAAVVDTEEQLEQLAAVGQGQRIPSEREVELARLCKELAEVKQERDLLK